MNSAVVFTSEQLTILNVLNAYYLDNLFNDGNTSTGASPLTLDTTTGVAVFTDSVGAASIINVTVNNSLITSTSLLEIGLKYPSTSGSGVLIQAGYTCSAGVFEVTIYNQDSSASAGNITITFKILNP